MMKHEDRELRHREAEIMRAWESARMPILRQLTVIYGEVMPSWLLHPNGAMTQWDDGLSPELRKGVEALRLTLADIEQGRQRDLHELYRLFRVTA